MPNVPFSASEAPTLPADPPTVSTASEGRGPAHSGHNLPQRDACDLCGSTCWDSAHFAMGKLWCEECWQGREPAEAKPPSPSEARQLALWMLPQPKSQPITQP